MPSSVLHEQNSYLVSLVYVKKKQQKCRNSDFQHENACTGAWVRIEKIHYGSSCVGWPADYFMTACQTYLVLNLIDEIRGIREQQARMGLSVDPC